MRTPLRPVLFKSSMNFRNTYPTRYYFVLYVPNLRWRIGPVGRPVEFNFIKLPFALYTCWWLLPLSRIYTWNFPVSARYRWRVHVVTAVPDKIRVRYIKIYEQKKLGRKLFPNATLISVPRTAVPCSFVPLKSLFPVQISLPGRQVGTADVGWGGTHKRHRVPSTGDLHTMAVIISIHSYFE